MKRKDTKQLLREVILAGAYGDYVDLNRLSLDIADSADRLSQESYYHMLDMLEYRAHELYLDNMRTPLKELVLWLHDEIGIEFSAELLSSDGIYLEVQLRYLKEHYGRNYVWNNPLLARIVERLVDDAIDDVSRETSYENCFRDYGRGI